MEFHHGKDMAAGTVAGNKARRGSQRPEGRPVGRPDPTHAISALPGRSFPPRHRPANSSGTSLCSRLSRAEVIDVYIDWGSYTFGPSIDRDAERDLFAPRLSDADAAVQSRGMAEANPEALRETSSLPAEALYRSGVKAQAGIEF